MPGDATDIPSYLFFNTRTHHGVFDEVLEADEELDEDRHKDLKKAKLTFTECILAILIALTFVCLLAEFLVHEIRPIVQKGIPDNFMGLILVPLVEKAAEHLTAVDEAWDDQIVRSCDEDQSSGADYCCRILPYITV